MNQVLVFIFGAVLGGVVAGLWFDKKCREIKNDLARTEKELEKEKEILGGFEEYNKKINQIKEEIKQKILDIIKEKGNIQTKEVAELFEVSRATAFRYLEELEKEGKIEQMGAFGREVKYRVKV